MTMAAVLARRSLCSRDQVGAVIVDVNGKIIGEGYNGPAKNYPHNNEPCIKWCNRAQAYAGALGRAVSPQSYGDCPALHAEANALMVSDRSLRQGGVIYVTSTICMDCAKLISNSGLAEVVVDASVQRQHRNWDAVREYLDMFVTVYEEPASGS